MAARIIHRGPHAPKPERPEIVNVRAGGTVRMRLRLTDGGVALDWTDPRVRVRDICVWSEPRRGVIAHPGFSFDADDPTLLVVEHTTSAADLPGIHRLVVDVSFTGWAAAHTVVAYNLVNSLALAGGDLQTSERWGVEEVSLQLHLHDVSTTWLQRLIDLLLKLRVSENERITALEVLTETLRNEVDDLTGRMETAEGDIGVLTEGMTTLVECCTRVNETLTDIGSRVGTLEECCKEVQQTLEDLEERVRKLEEGGTADPEPEPEYATLTITPDPSDATVVINGEERTELTAEVGTEIEWSVSKEGYVTQSGSLTITEDRTLNITLAHEGIVYSDIEITQFSYEDIPASGGTATPTLKYRQTWGYGSETGGGVIEDGAEVSYDGVEGDGSHTEGSLGTTARELTQVATASVTVTLNGRTATASAEVWQAENKVEEYYGLHWVTWSGEMDVTYDAHKCSAILSGYDSLQYRRYSSGSTDNFYVVPNGHTTYSDVEECDWARATSTGFELDENTSTEMRGPYDNIETCESEGETISRVRHVYQEGIEEVERTITFNVSPTDATLTVNGSEVTLSGGTYTMTAHDGDVIEWSCEKDGYIQQSGSHTVSGDATITVELEEEVVENPDRTITFNVSPTDSTIEVNGFIYQQDVDTGILEMRVKDGTVLEWSVYKDNYVTQSGSHTVDGDDTIEVTLESSSIGGIPPVSGEDSNITFDPEHPDNGATFKMTIKGSLATLLAWIDGYTPASDEQVVFVIDGTSYILYGEDNKTSIMLSVGEHTCSVTHSYTSVSSLSYPYKLCVSLSGTTYELSVGTFNVGGMNNSDGTESYSGDSDTQPASDTEAYSEGGESEEDNGNV